MIIVAFFSIENSINCMNCFWKNAMKRSENIAAYWSSNIKAVKLDTDNDEDNTALEKWQFFY